MRTPYPIPARSIPLTSASFLSHLRFGHSTTLSLPPLARRPICTRGPAGDNSGKQHTLEPAPKDGGRHRRFLEASQNLHQHPGCPPPHERSQLGISICQRLSVAICGRAAPPLAKGEEERRRGHPARCSAVRYSASAFSSSSPPSPAPMKFNDGAKFIEIAANLTDGMFRGEYHGKSAHPPDMQSVLARAWDAGVEKIIITGGNLEGSREALELARTDERLFCTVGVHPTRCSEFEDSGDPEKHLQKLLELAQDGKAEGKVVAVGECGLDYDRLQFCPVEVQKKYFALQFQVAASTKLPMFLHMRASAEDFLEIVKEHSQSLTQGVVHSFTGTAEERDAILANPKLFIGINGCSLKTQENLEVVKGIPPDRMMLETDSPYCDVRATHAGASFLVSKWPSKRKEAHDPSCLVKGRNEPCQIRQVFEVVCGSRSENDPSAFAASVFKATESVFFATK